MNSQNGIFNKAVYLIYGRYLMDYAVLLYFDDDASKKINKWTYDLVDLGLDRRYINIGMKPHLTLAEFNQTDLGSTEKLLQEYAAKKSSISLNFSSLGIFPTEQGVLFLNPSVSSDLTIMHQELNELLSDCCSDFSPLYNEENWVAHCTLGLDYNEEQMHQAYVHMRQVFEPLTAKTVSIVLYGCCPYHEMSVYPLNDHDI